MKPWDCILLFLVGVNVRRHLGRVEKLLVPSEWHFFSPDNIKLNERDSFLPEGTLARIPFYAVQRDPRNFFPHPEAFWPERWIIASSDGPRPDGFIHNTSAFIPFSIGPYNCVGKNLAMHEMRMVLSHTLQNLSINFAKGWDETVWEKELEDTFVFAKGKLPVTVTTRNLNGGAWVRWYPFYILPKYFPPLNFLCFQLQFSRL